VSFSQVVLSKSHALIAVCHPSYHQCLFRQTWQLPLYSPAQTVICCCIQT